MCIYVSMNYTTILVDEELKNILDTLKTHSRQSYRELISEMVKVYIEENKLKRFVKKAQEKKMLELWSNEDDEAWENV